MLDMCAIALYIFRFFRLVVLSQGTTTCLLASVAGGSFFPPACRVKNMYPSDFFVRTDGIRKTLKENDLGQSQVSIKEK